MRLLLLAAAIASGLPVAAAAQIAPHRAVYDLQLVRTSEGAALSSVDGRLAIEIQGSSCEGWTASFRMVNRLRPMEGEIKTLDVQSTSFESGDALGLRFQQKEFVNGSLQSETRIRVNRDTADGTGRGEQGSEGTAPFTVPAGAIFPMQHQLKLMAVAANGGSRDSSVIYDGSDGEKAFRAITFIGNRKAGGENIRDRNSQQAAPLAALASSPVSISFYPISEAASDAPDYQVSFDLYENGVATGLVLDYGEFVLGGSLASLEMLGQTGCD